MIAFFCRTPYHIFRTIQIKLELYPSIEAEIYVFDSFPNAKNIANRLIKANVFKNVFYIRDKHNYKKGYASSLRSIYGKTYLNSMLKGKFFSEIFLFNVFAYSNDVAINNVKRSNKLCVINIVEDGPTLYNIFPKDGITQNIIYPILRLWSPSKCIDYWWFSQPEMMFPFGKGKKKKLPKINKNNEKLVNVINYVFDYKENSAIKKADIIFMEECYWSDGLLRTNEDFELFVKIQEKFKQKDTCVKIHPRTKINRFKNQFDVVEADGTPWEVYALNMDIEKKILVSMLCSTMTSTKFLFGEETYSLLFYPMFTDKVLEVKTDEIYFTPEKTNQIKNQVKLYEDKSKFIIANTIEEIFTTIDAWLKIIEEKG